MAGKPKSPDRINPQPWIWSGLAILAAFAVMYNIDGNEHGASQTNLNTMPSYAVEPMEPIEVPQQEVPSKGQLAGVWVCNKIFYDHQRGEVVVRPVLGNPNDGRPLYLASTDAAGAHFMPSLPRDNFEVRNLDGSQDNDQRITPDECRQANLDVRSVVIDGITTHILVTENSQVDDGSTIKPGPYGAVQSGMIHGQFEDVTAAQAGAFFDKLPAGN